MIIYKFSWLDKKKKATINSINEEDECFQYAATIALSHEKIGKSPQRITKLLPFINRYNWAGIKYLSGKNDWVKFKKNNFNVVLYVLYIK